MKIKCSYTDLVKVKDLLTKQNPKNNNLHSREQIERLAKIVNFAGQRKPIVISKRSGLITKGHGLLLAIDHLKVKEAAVDYQDYNTDAEEYQDMTADNEIARWAKLDTNKFLEDIKDLDIGDIDLLGLDKLPELDFEGVKIAEDVVVSGAEMEEWVGMPEFTQDDKTGKRHLIVHFETEQDCKDFFELIGQKDTGKTKTIWFPPQERMDTESKCYGDE